MEDLNTVKPDFEDTYGVLQLTAKSEPIKDSDDSESIDNASQSSGLLFKIVQKIRAIFILLKK